jgi:hypothetical protein
MTQTSPGLLDKERTIADPGFNRWLMPPAALAIHLCIGMAYGFSVFWLPLSKAVGIKESIACGPDVGFFRNCLSPVAIGKFQPWAGCTRYFLFFWVHLRLFGAVGWNMSAPAKRL